MNYLLTFLTILCALCCFDANAGPVRKIKPRMVNFPDGRSFKLIGDLSQPDAYENFIYLTAEGSVLRVPANDHPMVTESATTGFVRAIESLRKNGVRVVKVLAWLPDHYVLVERVPLKFTMSELLSDPKLVDAKERAEVLRALMVFVRSTALYAHIGDFNPTQIGFTGKEWVLFDATPDHKTLGNFLKSSHWVPFEKAPHVFNSILEFEDLPGAAKVRAKFDRAFGRGASKKILKTIWSVRTYARCMKALDLTN